MSNDAVVNKEDAADQVINVTAAVKVPAVPNSLATDSGQKFPLSAFREEDIQKIGEAWTDALLQRWRDQRKEKA